MDAPAPPVATILLFRGKPALAAFRRERLVDRARASEPAVADLDGRWIYFVRTSDASGWIVQRLERLLDASCVMREQAIAALGCAIVVTPRPGTISAWSSKATDIARHCGLGCVTRIERGIAWTIAQTGGDPDETSRTLAESGLLHDRMTQRAHLPRTFLHDTFESDAGAQALFLDGTPPSHSTIRLGADARAALEDANASLGLALSTGELDYLVARFLELGRDPTDAELMMFAQVNSEHCRHKTFNASWTIDGVERERSLFDMIRHTQACNPGEVLSAYRDNAAVVRGHSASWFVAEPDTGRYSTVPGRVELVMKVETHNHPTAISPFPGAATGSGGEIRDEAATGRGARSKAGVAGFSVSNLRIPGFVQPWEHDRGRPSHIASALEIMLDGPIGAAAFNNEFGRPALGGYFRTLEIDVARAATSDGSGAGDPAARSAGAAREDFAGQEDDVGAGRRSRVYGYHKPIMIAGGVGNIRTDQVRKSGIAPGARLVVLGGPAMLIGLGGGAASSSGSRSGEESLDFASVQRENPEMQRRCQEVIDRCWQLGADNPILSIHDVGAGGLSNALPELVDGAGRGGTNRAARHPLRRSRDVAARDLVQRIPGALRPRHRTRSNRRLRGAVRARTLPLGGPRGSDPAPAARGARRQVPFLCGLDADGRPAGRASPHAPRRRTGAGPGGNVRHRPHRGRPGPGAGAARAGGRGQVVPGDHRRPHRRRTGGPRPDGRSLAGAGGRLRGHVERLPWIHRGSARDGRAHARRAARCARGGPDGGGGSADEHREHGRGEHRSGGAVGQLDGGLRGAGGGCGPLRRGRGGGDGALSRPRHLDPGREGLAVDEHDVARRLGRAQGGLAGLARRLGVRTGR